MPLHLVILRYWPIVAVLIGLYGLRNGWAAILLYHAGIVAVIFHERTAWKGIRSGFRPGPALGLFFAGVLVAPVVVILLPLLVQLSPGETTQTLRQGLATAGLEGISFSLFCLYLCLPHPSLEELGWREILDVDTTHLHLRDFEFASYHIFVMHFFFPGAWLFFFVCLVSLALVGWIWRLLKRRYGGLALPVWFHAGGDIGAMLGVWWLIR